MLFSDFAPTEIFFKGQNVNPKKEVAIIGQLKPKSRVQREMTFGLKFDFTNKGVDHQSYLCRPRVADFQTRICLISKACFLQPACD